MSARRLILLALALIALGTGASAAGAADRAPASAWAPAFSDGFDVGVDPSRWGRYEGMPGGNPGGWWDPAHVTSSGGIARLETWRDPAHGGRWVSGGMSSARTAAAPGGLTQTYGRWEVRMRMDPGPGVGGVILLWPERPAWPPEVDLYEDGGMAGHRRVMSVTVHHGPSDDTIQRTLRTVDFAAWHTVGVEWTPGRLVFTVDGRPWAWVRGAAVPREPMWLGIQTAAGTCGDRWAPCPDARTPDRVVMEVDRVRAWSYRPRN